MFLKKSKPTSPGIRHKLSLQKNLLAKNSNLVKTLISPDKRTFGRSKTSGKITFWHRGGGAKRSFRRLIGNNSSNISIVVGVFFDPNRNAFISLNFDVLKKKFDFSISPLSLFSGSCIFQNNNLDELTLGSRTSLSSIPTGSIFHNLGSKSSKMGLFGRSAGTYCQLIQKDAKTARIKLPSGKIIFLPISSFASIGIVSNIEQNKTIRGKAGVSRLKGRRPITRGIAMNPVDHPHGGRTNGGRPSCTPWGIPTKGKPTVKKKK